MTDSPDGAADFFRPLTDEEIQERIALVREAKNRKGHRKQLTKRELDKILGPSIDEILSKMSGPRRILAKVKVDNFGIIGVNRIDDRPTYRAHANSCGKTRAKLFDTYQEAVNQRNEWAAEFWPGIPEAMCDMDAAERKWGRKRRRKKPL